MSNVTPLFPKCAGPAEGLRNIAAQFDSGELANHRVTLVIGNEVYHLGTDGDAEAAQAAVFDLNVGLHRMLLAAFQVPTGVEQ